MLHWLTPDELLGLHEIVAEIFEADGDPMNTTGPRAEGLIEAATARPLAEFGGKVLYATDREKMAALIHAVNSSHVFRDGNKRTSVAALIVLLDRNGWRFEAEGGELSEALIALSSSAPPFDGPTDSVITELTSWIRARSSKKTASLGDMDTKDFLDRCAEIGGTWRKAGPSYVLHGPNGSVRISRSTHTLAEGVARTYVSKVGLSEPYSGVTRGEFIDGKRQDAALIRRYQEDLRRLAAHDRSE